MFLFIVIIFILTINYTQQYKLDCRTSTTDLQYKGHINTTRKGYTCKYWKDVKIYRTEEQNYCRTPPGDPDNAGGPWCYTSNRWDMCNVPVCGGKSCPNLTTNHLISKDGKSIYHYGETVSVSCETGYDLEGYSTISCEKSGQWNPTLPTCQGKHCPSLTNHLISKDGKSVYHYRDTIAVACEPGYHFKGDIILACEQSGQWNATLPTCEEITCTRMSLSLTEDINIMKHTHSYDYREMVTMSCKSGLTGTTVTSQCTDVNKWSHKPPICARIACTRTSLHLTRSVNVANDKQSYNFNEEVTLSCKHGFIGKTVTARCTDVSNWSENTPYCTKEYKGVSKVVFGVVVALIIVVAVGIIIGLVCFIRIKLKDSSRQNEDININMDQRINDNEDQLYSKLLIHND